MINTIIIYKIVLRTLGIIYICLTIRLIYVFLFKDNETDK